MNRNSILACKYHICIGSDVIIGPNVCLYDHNHTFGINGVKHSNLPDGYRCKPIIIGNNVWIGAGAIILAGSKIGDNSIIGAGCVIKGSIPSNSIVKNTNSYSIERLR